MSTDRHDHVTADASPGPADAKLAASLADAAKRRPLADRVGARTIAAELQAAERVRSLGWARV